MAKFCGCGWGPAPNDFDLANCPICGNGKGKIKNAKMSLIILLAGVLISLWVFLSWGQR